MQAPSINLMSWKTQNSASMMTKNSASMMTTNTLECLTKSNNLPKTCFHCLLVVHHSIDQGNRWWRRTFVDIHCFALVIENHCFLHWVISCLTLQILSLIAGFTVTLQAIMWNQAASLCFENHHACLVSSWADIVTVAAFWTIFFVISVLILNLLDFPSCHLLIKVFSLDVSIVIWIWFFVVSRIAKSQLILVSLWWKIYFMTPSRKLLRGGVRRLVKY